jgi:hypothetical protein
MEGIQIGKKKLNAFWEYIRNGMVGLREWIANLFESFFLTAKKEKKRLDKNTIRASPKAILSS